MDKSRVLDVKPLRSLAPVFSAASQAPQFVDVPPSGPFPAGFNPFYPSSLPRESQDLPDMCQQTPRGSDDNPKSFAETGIPPSADYVDLDSPIEGVSTEGGFSDGEKRSISHLNGASVSHRKKMMKSQKLVPSFSRNGDELSDDARGIINASLRNDGSEESVDFVLMTFDALRRRLSQVDDAKASGSSKNTHQKSATILMERGIRTNQTKRIGAIPGVEIGDVFFFRMELCLVGLHAQVMAGIDYMTARGGFGEEPVAVSIVSSGGYDDNAEDSNVLIYSGQGGNINKKDKPVADQKLQRGNLALENSLKKANEVRVIRGMKDVLNPLSKVYFYDGLYTVQESWVEKGNSGCGMFKYKLVRKPGQPDGFSCWENIQKWREGCTFRAGLILPDLSHGAEVIPVSLVNEIDDEKAPPYFTYLPSLRYKKSFTLTQPTYGCNCRTTCLPGNHNCSCIQKNGGEFPYIANGILVSRKTVIHECGPTCSCFPNCKNQVSQTGLKVRLEVFKTKEMGWGLRTLDPIRAGTFICEFAGEVIDAGLKHNGDDDEEDDYVFDSARTYDNPFKWNYDPLLLQDGSNESSEDYKIPSLLISAKSAGNVARFMNHSCSPNVFWQPVMHEHNCVSLVHITLFAMKHIPPMMELTYDYGMSELRRKKKCSCLSSKCKGYYA